METADACTPSAVAMSCVTAVRIAAELVPDSMAVYFRFGRERCSVMVASEFGGGTHAEGGVPAGLPHTPVKSAKSDERSARGPKTPLEAQHEPAKAVNRAMQLDAQSPEIDPPPDVGTLPDDPVR